MIVLLKQKQPNLKNKINSLVNKGYSDNQISSELMISRTYVHFWRKKFKIKTNYPKIKPIKINKIICSIINKEKPQACLTDLKLQITLKKKKINISLSTLYRCRIRLKIPPAGNKNGILTRQYLHYKSGKGRVIWSPDGKHYHRNTKESIF